MEQVHGLVASLGGSQREARSPFGGRVVIHATAAETGGRCGMWESFVPPGKGPGPHVHTRETEVFRVVRGRFRVRCGAEEFEATEGSVVTLPPGVEHDWRNIGDEPGQLFGIAMPGGFEGMFAAIAESGARSATVIARIERAFGIETAATRALGPVTE